MVAVFLEKRSVVEKLPPSPAAGIASLGPKHAKWGARMEFVDYLSPHQPGDFSHNATAKGRQFSTKNDRVSSDAGVLGWLLNFVNGGSKLAQIPGTSEYNVRDHHNGGKGGHMVDTWLNDLVTYWRGLGITVNVIE